jgi:hypothetical protein
MAGRWGPKPRSAGGCFASCRCWRGCERLVAGMMSAFTWLALGVLCCVSFFRRGAWGRFSGVADG